MKTVISACYNVIYNRRVNILVLYDEAEIADLAEVFLRNEDYTIYKFYHSKEVWNCIQNTDINLALLDVVPPNTNGFTILRKIREEVFLFPVFMLTVRVEDNDKITGLTFGADDYYQTI